jgi:hypothetical protein
MMTTSPPSCAECHEIWELKPPVNLWATGPCYGNPIPLPLPGRKLWFRFDTHEKQKLKLWSIKASGVLNKVSRRKRPEDNRQLQETNGAPHTTRIRGRMDVLELGHISLFCRVSKLDSLIVHPVA